MDAVVIQQMYDDLPQGYREVVDSWIATAALLYDKAENDKQYNSYSRGQYDQLLNTLKIEYSEEVAEVLEKRARLLLKHCRYVER